jgi:cell division protein FtsL
MGVFLLLGSFFVFGVLFYIWQQVQIVKLSYEIEDLKEIKKELSNVNRNLKLEVSSLKSLARIEKKAKTELGFELPRKGQILLAKEFIEPAQSSDFAEDSSGGSLIAQKLKSE